jgi:hypothetical protein
MFCWERTFEMEILLQSLKSRKIYQAEEDLYAILIFRFGVRHKLPAEQATGKHFKAGSISLFSFDQLPIEYNMEKNFKGAHPDSRFSYMQKLTLQSFCLHK